MPMKPKSAVWKFFDKVFKNGRCIEVVCQLCDKTYKFFGNTTNLKVHLTHKHPVEWQHNLDGTLDESTLICDEDDNAAGHLSPKSGKWKKRIHDDNEEQEDDEETKTYLVHKMNNDDEEWLEETLNEETAEVYEPPRNKIKVRKFKREIDSPQLAHRVSYTSRDKVNYENEMPVILDNLVKDEYSVFAEYIANKIRKFKSTKTRGNLQQLITTILWQAEYGLYDDSESVQKILMMPWQTPSSLCNNQVLQTSSGIEQVIETTSDEHVLQTSSGNHVLHSDDEIQLIHVEVPGT